ncbi:MAG: glycosyltransferase [Candidatus Omnitrophica bacterium]|nr:glycosyltransferase [Candidatus Omnitrophota bacterium]
MKVSVVMPVYNSRNVVGKAIESILQQTYADFEFIIIDDGSTDGTFNILEEYKNKDERIILVAQARKGLVYSLNRGLKLAKGEYILRQDGDDVSLPERMEKQLEAIKNNNLDIVGSYAYLVNEKGFTIEKIIRPVEHKSIVEKLERQNCILHPTLMFKKEAILSIGGYNGQYEFAQDYELYLRAVRAGLRIGCVPEPLVRIAHVSSSISVKRRRKQLLYAISAQAMHFAKQEQFEFSYPVHILFHISKIFIPMWFRKLRVCLRNRYQGKK